MKHTALFALALFMFLAMSGPVYADGKTNQGLILTLTLDTDYYNPEKPRSVPVVVTVSNPTKADLSFYAPEVHDGLTFRGESHVDSYRTHPMWLTTARLSQSKARPILLKPKEKRVIFRTNLADILPSGPKSSWRNFKPTRWSWTWGAKPQPPSSPIVPMKSSFPEIKKVTFWAQLNRQYDSPRSNQVTVHIGPKTK